MHWFTALMNQPTTQIIDAFIMKRLMLISFLLGMILGLILYYIMQCIIPYLIRCYKKRSLKSKKDHWLPSHPQLCPNEPYSWGFSYEISSMKSSELLLK